MILKLYRMAAQQYRAFSDKEEMNEYVSAHIFAADGMLHKNARAVLNIMGNHACIITGVSWLNEETIAEAGTASPLVLAIVCGVIRYL